MLSSLARSEASIRFTLTRAELILQEYEYRALYCQPPVIGFEYSTEHCKSGIKDVSISMRGRGTTVAIVDWSSHFGLVRLNADRLSPDEPEQSHLKSRPGGGGKERTGDNVVLSPLFQEGGTRVLKLILNPQ